MMGAVCRVLLTGAHMCGASGMPGQWSANRTELSNEDAAVQLFELLGDGALEAIEELMRLRTPLVSNLQALIASVQRMDERQGGDHQHSAVRCVCWCICVWMQNPCIHMLLCTFATR